MNIHPQIGPVCFQQLHCRRILSETAVVIEIIHAVCTCFLPTPGARRSGSAGSSGASVGDKTGWVAAQSSGVC